MPRETSPRLRGKRQLTEEYNISFWKELTGLQGISFLWTMPKSPLAEVGVGALVSLIPIGTSSP